MLNPNWKKEYDPKDFKDWSKLLSSAPPVVYPFQYEILYKLLRKYYRTNKGNPLNPDSQNKSGAYWDMVTRAMSELERAVAADERDQEIAWYEQRDKEEDLGAKLTREHDLNSSSSMNNISYRKANSSIISFRKKSSNVPNPLRRNMDYGPEWQSRVKKFEENTVEDIHDQSFNREGNE